VEYLLAATLLQGTIGVLCVTGSIRGVVFLTLPLLLVAMIFQIEVLEDITLPTWLIVCAGCLLALCVGNVLLLSGWARVVVHSLCTSGLVLCWIYGLLSYIVGRVDVTYIIWHIVPVVLYAVSVVLAYFVTLRSSIDVVAKTSSWSGQVSDYIVELAHPHAQYSYSMIDAFIVLFYIGLSATLEEALGSTATIALGISAIVVVDEEATLHGWFVSWAGDLSWKHTPALLAIFLALAEIGDDFTRRIILTMVSLDMVFTRCRISYSPGAPLAEKIWSTASCCSIGPPFSTVAWGIPDETTPPATLAHGKMRSSFQTVGSRICGGSLAR